MLETTHPSTRFHGDLALNAAELKDPVYQAYKLLHVGFTIAPIVAGLDKFFDVLVNWDAYLAPIANRVLAGHGHAFMMVVGVIEIIAGIGVALRDFGLLLGALALGRLSPRFARSARRETLR